MKVFSACLKMLRKHKSTFLTNLCAFAGLLAVMTLMSDSSIYNGAFNVEKPAYAIINRDGESPLLDGLSRVLEEKGTCVTLSDSKEALMDAGFFGAVEGIFIVPEGFSSNFWNGQAEKIGMWQRPSSADGYYLQSVVQEYLGAVKRYQNIDQTMPQEKIVEMAAALMEKEAEVSVRQYMSGGAVSEKIKLYQRFLPYVILLLCISCVNIVFLNFQRPEIRMRNLCSPMKPWEMAFQKLLYALVVGALTWSVLNVIGFAACAGDWKNVDARMVFLLLGNSFVLMLLGISVSLLVGCFVRSDTAQNFAANMVSLSMCFLSGVFVPLELLSEGILHAAKFIPVYWYEDNIERIWGLTAFDRENLVPILQGMGIQTGFAAALFCIYLVVNKYKENAAQAYGAVSTELES